MKQSPNYVEVEGILTEVNLEDKMSGSGLPYVKGNVTIRVEEEINHVKVQNDVKVAIFAMKNSSKTGKVNLAYTQAQSLKEMNPLSVVSDPAQATCIRVGGASLTNNEFISKTDGRLVYNPEVTASFFSRVDRASLNPHTKFDVTFVIASIADEVDNNNMPTQNLIIKGLVEQYAKEGTTNLQVINFIAKSPEAINYIRNNWEIGSTVNAKGKINFTVSTDETLEEVGFGEPSYRKTTTVVKEFVITAGSAGGVEPAYTTEEVTQALKDRDARLHEASKPKPKANALPDFSDRDGF